MKKLKLNLKKEKIMKSKMEKVNKKNLKNSKQNENLNLFGNPKSVWLVSSIKDLSKLKFEVKSK